MFAEDQRNIDKPFREVIQASKYLLSSPCIDSENEEEDDGEVRTRRF